MEATSDQIGITPALTDACGPLRMPTRPDEATSSVRISSGHGEEIECISIFHESKVLNSYDLARTASRQELVMEPMAQLVDRVT